MTIGDALYQHLSADPALSSIVAGRIVPVQWGAGTEFPLITYVKISENEGFTHDGWDGTGSIRMQLTAWTDGSVTDAEDLAQAMKTSIRKFDRTARMVSERQTVDAQTTYHQFIQDWMFIWNGTASPRQV